MNPKFLRIKMLINGDTNATLAQYVGITPQRFSAKLNETGGAEFTQGEIEKIRCKYHLTPQEVIDIFFAH